MITTKFKKTKRSLPHNWRMLVQQEYVKHGKSITLQRLTNLSSGKVKDLDAIEELLVHLNAVKETYKKKIADLQNRLK